MAAFKLSNLFKGNPTLWGVYLLLFFISLIEVFSAGSTLSFKSGNYMAPLFGQATYLFLGCLIIIAFSHVPCRHFQPFGFILGFGTLIGLVALFLFGSSVNGGARWISLFGFTIQPSEFVKPALICMVASFLKQSYQQNTKEVQAFSFWSTLIASGLFCILIVFENFSTAALIGLTILIMLLCSNVPLKWIGKTVGIGVVALLLFFTLAYTGVFSSGVGRSNTWVSRIERFSDKKEDPVKMNRPDLVDFDARGQENHAKIAVATSAFLGKGPGHSVQRDHLSQAYSDFIFAIIVEEGGFLGALIVISLYFSFFFTCCRISRRCENAFPAYLIIGLSSIITIQSLVNMAVAVGLMPITGQTLPFVSRGGSSILATSIMYGMILSVSRFARRAKTGKDLENLSPEELEAEAIEADFSRMEEGK